uniref:Uncharacterized protein n=1 Tax=Arcella intermedia TaxID=1963864 RepID=A0A6B2LJ50_9EUKA
MKCVLTGDSGTGKSSFLQRVINNQFSDNYIPIAIDFGRKQFCKPNKNGVETEFTLQLWDIDLNHKFRTISTVYFRNSKGFVIMYDITQQTSFDNVLNWLNEIKRRTDSDEYVLFLVGTKSDLSNERVISAEKGMELAASLGCSFFEVSSKEDKNVESTVSAMVEAMIKLVKDPEETPQIQEDPSLFNRLYSWVTNLF